MFYAKLNLPDDDPLTVRLRKLRDLLESEMPHDIGRRMSTQQFVYAVLTAGAEAMERGSFVAPHSHEDDEVFVLRDGDGQTLFNKDLTELLSTTGKGGSVIAEAREGGRVLFNWNGDVAAWVAEA